MAWIIITNVGERRFACHAMAARRPVGAQTFSPNAICSKEEKIELEGEVTESLRNGMFRIALDIRGLWPLLAWRYPVGHCGIPFGTPWPVGARDAKTLTPNSSAQQPIGLSVMPPLQHPPGK